MIKYILVLCTVLLFSCKNHKQEPAFSAPANKDINDIISTIIDKDSIFLKGLKSRTIILDDGTKYSYTPDPVCIDLVKSRIVIHPDSIVTMPYPAITIRNLLFMKVNEKAFFQKSDSSYFLFQNEVIKHFIIDKKTASEIVVTTIEREETKEKLHQRVSYLNFSIPIFSLDNKRAYIILTNVCNSLCGGATAYYLEKINDKWVVVDKQGLWVS